MSPRYWLYTGAALFVLAAIGGGYALSVRQSGDMAAIEAWVRQSHPAVEHIDKATFDAMAARGDVLALDVRTPAEFAVSHKPGAVHVEPNISAEDFIAQYGDAIRGKVLLVYCSVGKRSSHLAERLGETMLRNGAAGIFNIEGGIFGWHNEFRPLNRRMNPTEYVHPFNSDWARYLKRRELSRYTPDG